MDNQLEKIRTFVGQHVQEADFPDGQDIFASGHVSSLFAVQIVMFVETTFGIQVADDDLDIRNFSSIANIDRYVTGKRAPASAAS
jgi:methoxymalonate biosynthesis acyl carrier protein